jgi:hypothetical protein
VCVCVCVCLCICVCVCVCVCMFVCMCLCVCVYVFVCVCDFVLGALCSHCGPVNFQTLRNRDLHQVSFLTLINQLERFMKCLRMPLMMMP